MSDDPMMPIGYRSYRVSQLVDAQVIKRLRDLDVPLRAVAEIVQARDPEVTQSVIADHEQMMREHLVDLARLVDELQAAITQLALQTRPTCAESPTSMSWRSVSLVDDPGHDSYVAFLDSAYQRLSGAVQRLGATPTGPSGAMYPTEVDDDSEVITAFVPIAAPVVLDDLDRDGFMFIQVPEGKAVKYRVHLDFDSDDIAGEVARVIDLGATHIHDTAEFGLTGPLSPTPKATSSSSAARTTDRPSANSVTALWNSPRWSREPRCDPNTPDRGGGTSAVTLRHVVHTHHDLTGQDGLRPVPLRSSLPCRHGRRDGR